MNGPVRACMFCGGAPWFEVSWSQTRLGGWSRGGAIGDICKSDECARRAEAQMQAEVPRRKAGEEEPQLRRALLHRLRGEYTTV